MEKQLKNWMCRDLTLNGKSIIAKTFGLSQVIYCMQMGEIKDQDLRRIETIYFKFLWSKSWKGNHPERIKRSLLKNEKNRGGINALDIRSMYEAIKVRQVINALKSNILKDIQLRLLSEGNRNYKNNLNFFFKNLSTMDETTYTCQCVINAILEHYCKINYGSQEDEINTKLITMGKYLDVESYARTDHEKTKL
jgi:hypothetical protein